MWPVDPLVRTCTELLPPNDKAEVQSSQAPPPVITVRELAEVPVFVLLGEPGMGKSETMKALAIFVLGEQGRPVAANDFIVLPTSTREAGKPVFIDALDEARADGDTTVWRALRTSIAHGKLTRFGISCRIADWQGTDIQDLATVTQGQPIRVFALNPLSSEQRQAVLKDEHIDDVGNFEKQAQTLGFSDMLGNPKSLELLVASVKENQGQWPNTRREAYELACHALVQEPNQRHRQAKRSNAPLSSEALLGAAGWLCALMLLSNQNEVADETLGAEAQEGVRLSDVLDALPAGDNPIDAIRQVLSRRLFVKPRGYSATHRTVAEYLAARYIAKRIAHGGLQPGRVASLMLASSKHVVSNLRGLAGWLAVVSEPMRAPIFEADPVAVLDYGDLHLLPVGAKQALVEQLAVSPRTHSESVLWQKAEAHVPLVQAEMQGFVTTWLASSRRNRNPSIQQSLVVDVLLSALIKAPADQYWEPILIQWVRDESLSEDDRSLALQALYTHCAHPSVLTALLEDIHLGRLSESRGRLTGSLLQTLYPKHIRPSQVLRFLRPTHVSAGLSDFPMFWGYSIEKKTSPDLLPELMEALENKVNAGTFSDDSFVMARHHLEGLETLVVTAICRFGASIEEAKLSRWLAMCANTDEAPFQHLTSKNAHRMDEWARTHTDLIQQVLLHWVREGATSWEAQSRLQSTWRPPQLGAFWLNQARMFQALHEDQKARDCLETAFWWSKSEESGISIQDLEDAAAESPNLKAALEPLLISPLNEENWQRKSWLRDKKHRAAETARQELNERNRIYLLDHLADVQEGKLLTYLSGAAWDDLRDSGYGRWPDGTLFKEWRESHPELDAATRQGYQTLLLQLTATQAANAVRNHATGHLLHIELPCLLAAQHLYAESSQRFFDLREERLKALLTLHLLNHSTDNAWLIALAERHPDWVETVWWSLCESRLRSRKDVCIPQIGLLRHEAGLRQMALRLLPRILISWPSKISEANFPEFVQVLDAVLEQCAPDEVSRLVSERLKRKSLGSLQTSYLLMAGVWVDHPTFVPMLQQSLSRKQLLQTELLGFVGHLHRYGGRTEALPAWDAPTLGLLFRIFGPLCPAERPDGVNWIGVKDEGRRLLHQVLDSLRNDTGEAAHQELQQLLSDPALHEWKHRLQECLLRQSQARAEKSFSLPTPRQVALMLHNKTPANPADLMAAALDALVVLQTTLHNSDTNRLHRFWTVDSAGKRPRPPHRPEPECRNAIAEWLRADLAAMDISVAVENQHGAQNQSDIVLKVRTPAHDDMLLPIEIKGDWNRDLWTAATEQLAAQYASEPRCHGQGIYLVLWLGGNRGQAAKPKPHPNYPTQTPTDLQMRLQLEATQKASGQNIRVIVLDVSIPV